MEVLKNSKDQKTGYFKNILLVFVFILISSYSYSVIYTSIADGDWEATESIWDDNNMPAYNDGLKTGDEIIIQHVVFLLADFDARNGLTIKIHDGAILEIFGNFDVDNNVTISIAGDGELIIHGNFSAWNNANVTIEGNVSIGGNMNFWNNGSIDLTGGATLNVGGEICGKTGTCLTIIGDDTSELNYGSICEDGIQLYNGLPLPIDLICFYAEVKNEDVILNWSTASEINNAYFTIERSLNMQDWDVAGTVAGAGTTSQVQHYAFTDPFPFMGLSYYRLKQTDFDGRFEYFAPVAVNAGKALKAFTFNLLKQAETWTIGVQETSECMVEVYSLNGIKLFSGSFSGTISIPAPRQAAVVRVLNDKQQTASRVVM